MIYRVIKAFADSKDEMHVYQPGEIFRAENTSAKRLAQLMTSNNMVGCPLIVEESQETPVTPAKSHQKADAVTAKEKPSPRKKAVK